MNSSDRFSTVFVLGVCSVLITMIVAMYNGHVVSEQTNRVIAVPCVRSGGAWKSNQVGTMECVR